MSEMRSDMRFIERTPDLAMCPLRSQGDNIVLCSIYCVFLHKTRYRVGNSYPEIYYCGNANGIKPMEPAYRRSNER